MARGDLDVQRLIRHLQDRLAEIEARNEELERRVHNMFREATVTALHEDEAMAEVDADGLPSDKVPWLCRAGKQREWDPVTVGERVILISPSGDPALGLILPGGFSNKFKPNHDKAGEHRRSVGDKVSTTTTAESKTTQTEKVKATQYADKHVVEAGDTKFATLQDRNVSDAAKTVVRQKLLVASGGVVT